ncbi:hypothetical protein Nmel_015325 [Mimus melanotis]
MSPGAAGGPGDVLPQLRHPCVTPAHTGQRFGCGVSRVPALRRTSRAAHPPSPPSPFQPAVPPLHGPRDTAPVTGRASSPIPDRTHPWVGGGRRWGRGGASPSRRYIGRPPVLALSLLLSHRRVTKMTSYTDKGEKLEEAEKLLPLLTHTQGKCDLHLPSWLLSMACGPPELQLQPEGLFLAHRLHPTTATSWALRSWRTGGWRLAAGRWCHMWSSRTRSCLFSHPL